MKQPLRTLLFLDHPAAGAIAALFALALLGAEILLTGYASTADTAFGAFVATALRRPTVVFESFVLLWALVLWGRYHAAILLRDGTASRPLAVVGGLFAAILPLLAGVVQMAVARKRKDGVLCGLAAAETFCLVASPHVALLPGALGAVGLLVALVAVRRFDRGPEPFSAHRASFASLAAILLSVVGANVAAKVAVSPERTAAKADAFVAELRRATGSELVPEVVYEHWAALETPSDDPAESRLFEAFRSDVPEDLLARAENGSFPPERAEALRRRLDAHPDAVARALARTEPGAAPFPIVSDDGPFLGRSTLPDVGAATGIARVLLGRGAIAAAEGDAAGVLDADRRLRRLRDALDFPPLLATLAAVQYDRLRAELVAAALPLLPDEALAERLADAPPADETLRRRIRDLQLFHRLEPAEAVSFLGVHVRTISLTGYSPGSLFALESASRFCLQRRLDGFARGLADGAAALVPLLSSPLSERDADEFAALAEALDARHPNPRVAAVLPYAQYSKLATLPLSETPALLLAAVRIERFRRAEGRLPAALSELGEPVPHGLFRDSVVAYDPAPDGSFALSIRHDSAAIGDASLRVPAPCIVPARTLLSQLP